ncbi:MAG: hypothetical protein HUU16_04845 [Candidatus Omnitrophica bacterium]|nr:hypothetical protein [Candidatus Omnitrophota bacterium]
MMAPYGNHVLVGAPGDRVNGVSGGAAYRFDPLLGQVVREYHNPFPNQGDSFGYWVAAAGDYVLVGARGDDLDETDAGAAFLFDADTGALQKILHNPSPNRGDDFGITVAGLPGFALVGAMSDDTRGRDAGAAFLFNTETGELIHSLYSPSPSSDGFFGTVSASDGRLLIGAPGDGPQSEGAAYLFDAVSGQHIFTFQNPTPGTLDGFGNRLDIVGTSVLIGSPRDNTAGSNAGAAYLFRPANFPPNPPTVTLSPEAPFTLDNLLCAAAGSTDPEGASVTYEYKWYRDDVLITGDGLNSVTGPTLSHLYTSRGDAIRCTVRATDGVTFSTPTSDSVVILNTPPPRPEVRILPENPTPDDGLAVLLENPDPVDPDGDVILPLFSWYQSVNASAWIRRPELSGSLFPNFYPGQPEISALYTQAAEYWRVDVTFVDFENELAAQAALHGKSLFDPEKDVSDTDTYVTFILPDIDGDNQVGASDLLLMRSFWLNTQSEIPIRYRPAFFEPSDSPEKRIGVENLLGLAGPGWHRGAGN